MKIIRRNQIASGQPPRYTGVWAQASAEDVQSQFEKGNKPVYRFRIPKKSNIEFVDVVKGEQSFATDDLDDFIVKKQDNTPTFMFANAIDDSLMKVDLVLRGDDHLSNTPRQIALLEALNLPLPKFAHVSLFTGSDGAPLSKRNGSLSIEDLRSEGYLPIAVCNYLSRVGHSINTNKLMSLKELSKSFDTNNISSSPSKFDKNQLLFWQKKAVESLSSDETYIWLQDSLEALPSDINKDKFLSLVKENINFPVEVKTYIENLFLLPLNQNEQVKPILLDAGRQFFKASCNEVSQGIQDWEKTVKKIALATEKKGKELFMPIRAAITGQTNGPELDRVVELIGIDRVQSRLKEASEL